jgi:hypothetical protein
MASILIHVIRRTFQSRGFILWTASCLRQSDLTVRLLDLLSASFQAHPFHLERLHFVKGDGPDGPDHIAQTLP